MSRKALNNEGGSHYPTGKWAIGMIQDDHDDDDEHVYLDMPDEDDAR